MTQTGEPAAAASGGLLRRTFRRITAGYLWHHADFRRLWVGDTASQLGASFGNIALPYLAVTLLAATSFQMGLLGTLQGLGFLLIGLPAGALVDRWRKRTVMLVADLCRATLLLSITAAWWLDWLSFTQLAVVATAVGVLTVFFDVSYQSYLPFLVGHDHIVEGNAKLQASQSVSQAVGPALGGVAIKYLGAADVVGVNAVGYLSSAAALWRIRHRETPPPRETRRPLTTEIAEGLGFVLRHPLLRRLLACTAIGNMTGSAAGALTMLYMVRELHLSAVTIGVIEAVGAVGGFCGALIVTPITRRLGEGATIIVTAAVFAPMPFVYPLASVLPPVPTLIVGFIGFMMMVVAYNIATVSFRQRLCPPEMLGRMNASARFIVWGTIPIGAFIGGVLGTHLGVLTTLWVTATAGLASVLPVASRTLWRLRKLPSHDDVPPDADVPADADMPGDDVVLADDENPAVGTRRPDGSRPGEVVIPIDDDNPSDIGMAPHRSFEALAKARRGSDEYRAGHDEAQAAFRSEEAAPGLRDTAVVATADDEASDDSPRKDPAPGA